MKRFIICDDSLIFNFLREIDALDEVKLLCSLLMNRIPGISENDAQVISDQLTDDLHDDIYELGSPIWTEINEYSIDEYEVEEGTGTWGYLTLEFYEDFDITGHFNEIIKEGVEKYVDKKLPTIIKQIESRNNTAPTI
jgi:hypothetical protein